MSRLFLLAFPALLILFALSACGGSTPLGQELDRHAYDGDTYILVEYGHELAVFTESGSPVSDQALASEVFRSYAWLLALDGLDVGQIANTAIKVDAVDSSIDSVRSLSKATVGIFDDLEELSADIPLLGEISAMDSVREAYPGVGTAESALRSLNSELNDFGDSADALTEASRQLARLDASTEIDGGEMDRLFRDAVSAAHGLGSTVESVKGSASSAQDAAGNLESALREISDTPIIGGAVGGLASTVARFESELSELTRLLGDFGGELSELGAAFQSTLDSAVTAHEGYMERWLEEPHDPQWPPTDPESSRDGTV